MKSLFLILSFFFSVNAFAGNSYCDSRPQQRSKVMCYEQAITMQNNLVQTNYNALSSKMPSKQFNALVEEGRHWSAEVNNRCTTSLVCVHDSLRNRNDYLADLRRKYK